MSKKFFMYVLMVTFPVFLVLTNVYFLTSSSFVEYVYSKSSFPGSTYLSNEERISIARRIIAYLYEKEDISSLKALDVFTEKEIVHLSDVQELMNKAFLVQKVSAGLMILSAIVLSMDKKFKKKIPSCLFTASMITIIFFSLMMILINTNFDWFFVTFHRLLFPPGSWSFLETDTLIQLFPREFWVEVGKMFGFLVLTESLLMSIVVRRFNKNK